MSKAVLIRDTVLRILKREDGFNSMTVAEIDGNYFSAADVALSDVEGNCEVYRIAVVKHKQQKRFD